MATTIGTGPAPIVAAPPAGPAAAAPAAKPSPRPAYAYTGEARAEFLNYSEDLVEARKLPVFVRPGVNCADCHPKKKDEGFKLELSGFGYQPTQPKPASAAPWNQGEAGVYAGPTATGSGYPAIPEGQFPKLRELLQKGTDFSYETRDELQKLMMCLMMQQPLAKDLSPELIGRLWSRLLQSKDATDRRTAEMFFGVASSHPELTRLSLDMLREARVGDDPFRFPLNKTQWQELMRYKDVDVYKRYALANLKLDPKTIQTPLSAGLLEALAPRMTAGEADQVMDALPKYYRADLPPIDPYKAPYGYRAKPPTMDELRLAAAVENRQRAALAAVKALAFDHPDAAVRSKALARYFDAFMDKSKAMASLTKEQAQAAYALALKGGPAGQALQSLNTDNNPNQVNWGDVSKLQGEVFKRLMEVCQDPNKAARYLPADLMKNFDHHKKMLKDVGLLAIAMSAKNPAQLDKLGIKNVDKEKLQKAFQLALCQPAAKAVIEAIRQDILKNEMAPQNGRVIENVEYLRGPKFRDRLLMLSGGDTSQLNEKQLRLIMDEVGKASALSKDKEAGKKIMQDVMLSLMQDQRFGFAIKPEELAAVQKDLDALLKDPKLTEEQRTSLKGIMTDGMVTVGTVLKLMDLHRSITTGQNPLLIPGPLAKKISCALVGQALGPIVARFGNPVGTAVSIVMSYNGVVDAYANGDGRNLALKGGALVATTAGAAAGTWGAVALACGASGPPGWIVGGLLALGAGLTAAACFWGESEVESACNRWHVPH